MAKVVAHKNPLSPLQVLGMLLRKWQKWVFPVGVGAAICGVIHFRGRSASPLPPPESGQSGFVTELGKMEIRSLPGIWLVAARSNPHLIQLRCIHPVASQGINRSTDLKM